MQKAGNYADAELRRQRLAKFAAFCLLNFAFRLPGAQTLAAAFTPEVWIADANPLVRLRFADKRRR
jgi:hypothetical protein